MHWDYKDQLRQTDLGGGGAAYYVYDASGQRVRKVWEKAPGLIEERIYLGGFEIFRKHGGPIGANTATLERETLHVMDDKQRIALVETRTLDTAGNDPAPRQLIRYQFGNHLGSASLELDEQAQIISYEEYAPYGSTTYQAVRSQTETPKRYRYTGKERDEESGLYYHGARYYAPWLGRWTSVDPSGLRDGTNVYAYVKNNPTNYSDPTGLLSWGQWAGIGAAVVVGTVLTVATAGLAGPIVGTAAAAVIGGIVGGAAGGAVAELTEAAVDKRSTSAAQVGKAALIGAAFGGAFAGAGAFVSAAARGGGGALGAVARTVAGRLVNSGVGETLKSAASSVAGSGVGQAVRQGAQRVSQSSVGQAVQGGVKRVTGGLEALRGGAERLGTSIGQKIPGTPAAKAAAQAQAFDAAGARLDQLVHQGGPMPAGPRARAVGAAIVDVPGYTGQTEMRAVSAAATDALGQGAPVHHATSPATRTLQPVRHMTGTPEAAVSHINDVEVKMLQDIANGLPQNASGTVHLTSIRSSMGGSVLEPLPACSACTFFMHQFAGTFRRPVGVARSHESAAHDTDVHSGVFGVEWRPGCDGCGHQQPGKRSAVDEAHSAVRRRTPRRCQSN